MFGPDELAGIVDTFDALERSELLRACSETAFRRGESIDEAAFEASIDEALTEYALIEHDGRLVAGPAAFPQLPEGAEDLPHILDVGDRSVDRAAVAETAAERVRAAVDDAVDDGDAERAAELLDRCYEVEAWGPVDLEAARERLDEVVDTAEG